jgi:hypothetical protein
MGPLLVAAAFVVPIAGPAQAQREPPSRQMPQQRPGPQAQAPAQMQPQRGPGQPQAAVQGSVSAQFRTALEPHGRWQQHQRFGQVWIPANRPRDWRPYTVGRWVYSDDWGWYWAEDREEADWGWATYHYGRWIDDADLGWAWIPGEEWGPGFVQWRHSNEYVGWAPLPPEEIVVEYRDRPDVWLFVRTRDFVVAPRLAAVILPVRDYPVFVRDTVVVNQTVILHEGGRFAVNPGIPAALIAAEIGRPIRAFDVRPRVLAGTAQIPGAIEVRAQDIRSGSFRTQTTVRESRNEIRPAANAQQLQPLAPGEQGRLGANPPRAAQRQGLQQGLQPPSATTGQQQQGQQQGRQPQQQGQQQPAQQPQRQVQPRQGQQQQGQQQQGQQPPPATTGQQQTPQQRQQQGRGKQEPPQTQGRGAQEQLQQQQQGQRQTPQQQQGRDKQEAPAAQTQGRGAQEQRQQQGQQPTPQQRQGQQPTQQRPGTEGRGGVDTSRSPAERSGAQQRQQGPTERSGAREQRPEQGTSGRGGAATERPRVQERPQVQQRPQVQERPQVQQRPQAQERSQPQQRSAPSATEGRGGGGGAAPGRGPGGGGAAQGRGPGGGSEGRGGMR